MWGVRVRAGKRPRLISPEWEKPPAIRLIGKGSLGGPSAAMRSTWRDPDDHRVNARLAREVNGHRAYDPLRWCLKRHGPESRVTEGHIAAADKLRQAADLAVVGRGGRSWLGLLPVGIMRVRTTPTDAERANLRAWAEVRRAMALYDATQRELVTHIVLLNWAVRHWVEMLRGRGQPATPPVEMGKLVDCLDRLEDHYRSDVDRMLRRGWMP
jgi:hypothetical protein